MRIGKKETYTSFSTRVEPRKRLHKRKTGRWDRIASAGTGRKRGCRELTKKKQGKLCFSNL